MSEENLELLKHLSSESLQLMAVVAEHSLPIIGMHVRRVRGYAQVLATALELTESHTALIADACQLHDVGMVSVPVSVVRKATNLSHEEWEIVRQHPEVGARLMRNGSHEVFKIAEIVALTHHERWDGSGYPHGLRGESIPLAGRICGLCDVFDTLTHGRAYKQALKPDEVLLLLQESSETFFDPKLVELFTRSYAEILAVRERYKYEGPETIVGE